MEDVSTQASVEQSSTVAAAPSEAPQSPQTSDSTQAIPATQASTEGQGEAVLPQYTPNFKYKAMGKEYEFDESIRGLVKAKEHEDKLRELYEKAGGLDAIKQERDQIRNDYKRWEPIVKDVQTAGSFYEKAQQYYKSGDMTSAVFSMDNFFKHMGVPEKVIQQYVLNKLQMEDLPQEQKAAYTKNQELMSQYEAMQSQLSQYEQMNQQMAVERKVNELSQALSKPEVQSFQQAFDQRNGQDAFKREIIRLGQWYEANNQKSPSADEIVHELVNKYGFAIQASQPQHQTTQQPQTLPVIPVVKGGGSSPTVRKVQSLDDLKKIRVEKFGS